jgi:hypothetical protein
MYKFRYLAIIQPVDVRSIQIFEHVQAAASR